MSSGALKENKNMDLLPLSASCRAKIIRAILDHEDRTEHSKTCTSEGGSGDTVMQQMSNLIPQCCGESAGRYLLL